LPKYTHENIGEAVRTKFVIGSITTVNADSDTADVIVPGYGARPALPLFYHCSPDAVLLPSGALEGAGKAFSDGDQVVVMMKAQGFGAYVPECVVGFADGNLRECEDESGYYAIILLGNTCIVWDVENDKVADDIPLNGDPDVMAAFPISRHDISVWRESVNNVPSNPLFNEQTESGSHEGAQDTNTDVNNILTPCGGSGYDDQKSTRTVTKTTIGRKPNLFGWDNVANHSAIKVNFSHTPCPGVPGGYSSLAEDTDTYSNLTDGFELTPLNIAGTPLRFWEKEEIAYTESYGHRDTFGGCFPPAHWTQSFDTTYTRHCSHYFTDMNNINNPQSNSWECDAPFIKICGDNPGCFSDSKDEAEDDPIVKGLGIHYDAKYTNKDNGYLIGQIFLGQIPQSMSSIYYSAYATIGMGIGEVGTDPVLLQENNALSSLLFQTMQNEISRELSLTFVK